MSASDAHSDQPRDPCAGSDPPWLAVIVAWLRENRLKLDPYEHVQFVFNRSGDRVQADYSIKSIKLR